MNSNEETKSEDFKNMRCRHGRRYFWKMPIIIVAIVALKSAAVFYLWNCLIPDLFHGPTVTYVQALGLLVLAKLLVGFHGGRHFGGHHHGWRRKWWEQLSPEEREKFKEKMRNKFC